MPLPVFLSIYVFIIGLVFGSFLNVLIARLPRGISIAFPPSNCPKCGHRIRFYHNIPLIGFLLLKGRCRDCGEKISLKYPLVELLTGVIFLLVFLKFGMSLYTLKYSVFVFLLLGAGLTDVFTAADAEFECGIIPDTYTLGGAVAGVFFSFITYPGIQTSLLGALAGFLSLWIPAWLYKKLRRQEGMGGGDIKLMMMIGAFLGYVPVYFIVFGSAVIGSLVGIPLVILKKDKNYMIPFGVFIAAAAVLYIFFEPRIMALMLP
ncbi:prepilin peptidase [Geovibrio thiophilus]|uniref:Prepilin peptidase n=1 Tax=Geovibrio thiophilus TaxID=139438 RepID=A0A3R5XYR2_9BACT|nr:A24 family peptidase [Geovibrio thiophilus]QAR34028.1 prepilin peptidase [Geovibrio thiophilus]